MKQELSFIEADPAKAYIYNNLIIPKALIRTEAIKQALTFNIGEEIIYDEGEPVAKRSKVTELWDETENHIIVPREFISPDKYKLYRFPFIDIRPQDFESIEVEDLIDLRNDTQEKALQSLLWHRSGTLNLGCGKGKTVIALKLIAALKVPTIIIVNSSALMDQWRERIAEHLKVKSVGTIQGDTYDWRHPIVLAMVQTLANRHLQYDLEFRRRFGLVIYDEGHHMSAPKFVLSADMFFGRRYSLTATARRTDGLEGIYQAHLGRIIYTDLEQALIPDTSFHIINWELPPADEPLIRDVSGEVNTSKIRTYIGTLTWRNNIIFRIARADLAAGRKLLILSHSEEHVRRMAEEFGGTSGWVTGKAKREDRLSTFRERNPVFATFQLVREWLDVADLDALYITTVFSNSNDLQQAWGRTQREHTGKQNPIVRVFEDTAIKSCVGGCRKLRGYLKALGYPFKKIKTER
jgi:superfamily II DNA or RNA helicase